MNFLDYTGLKRVIEKIKSKYLPLNGGTITGSLTVNSTLQSKGSVEVYGSTPHIDFHFRNSNADYTSRIIQEESDTLNINGLKINQNGQIALKGASFDQGLSMQSGLVVGNYAQGDSAGYYAIYCAGGIIHNTSNGAKFSITASGNATFSGNVVAKQHVTNSDERLKENIGTIAEDIEKIKEVEFKEFNFKCDDYKTKSYGVIAQDLEKAGLKNLVVEDTNGYKSVDYTALIMLELQRLRKEIQNLKAKYNGNN